jgi:hypothetical protein
MKAFSRHGYASYNLGLQKPQWELITLCIICKQQIVHNQYQKLHLYTSNYDNAQQKNFSRIAHIRCTKGYFKK